MEEVHIVSGKTRVIQLTMLVIGFEGMIFNIMGQYNVFPCEPPLNFSTRVQGKMFTRRGGAAYESHANRTRRAAKRWCD